MELKSKFMKYYFDMHIQLHIDKICLTSFICQSLFGLGAII